MGSFVKKIWTHWIIYVIFLVTYVFKSAYGQRFCVGRSVEIHCDHKMFPAFPKQGILSTIEISKVGTSSVAECYKNMTIKKAASRWMLSCGHDYWDIKTFRVSLYILHGKKADAGKYKCKVTNTQMQKNSTDLGDVKIQDTCIGQALFLPGFSRGPELVSEYEIPKPNNPWPKLIPLMDIIVKSYAILMGGLAVVALMSQCAPQRLFKRAMGQTAKSSEGSSSSSSGSSRNVKSVKKVNAEVYGRGSNVIAVVDDTYMQDDYQTPTGSLVLIQDTLRINPEPLSFH